MLKGRPLWHTRPHAKATMLLSATSTGQTTVLSQAGCITRSCAEGTLPYKFLCLSAAGEEELYRLLSTLETDCIAAVIERSIQPEHNRLRDLKVMFVRKSSLSCWCRSMPRAAGWPSAVLQCRGHCSGLLCQCNRCRGSLHSF